MPWAVAIPLAFLAGSIPFSLLIGLARGVDIRTVGSKNVGATNLGRTLGGQYFALGFTLDMLKGFAPTLAAGLVAGVVGKTDLPTTQAWLWLATAAAAPLGHMFSPWVGFKGGKGVATGLGALLGVFPALTLPAVGGLFVFLTVLALWRYVSLASCAAAIAIPVLTLLLFGQIRTLEAQRAMPEDPATVSPEQAENLREAAKAPHDPVPFVALTSVLAVLVVAKHRGNLARIAAGTEPKTGQRKPDQPTPEPPQAGAPTP